MGTNAGVNQCFLIGFDFHFAGRKFRSWIIEVVKTLMAVEVTDLSGYSIVAIWLNGHNVPARVPSNSCLLPIEYDYSQL